MFIVFVIGTAGSGKSLFTSAYSEWLKVEKQDVAAINLDPGVLALPYTPDLDIRDYVNIESLMKEHLLGPNGALIAAADLIAEQVEKLSREIEELKADIVLVDTPGQMELFAFRASGPYIADGLTKEPKAITYLFDSVFSLNPLNYVANLFLSAAVYNRFLIPQIHVLSKSDLLPQEQVDRIIGWSVDPEMLTMDIDNQLKGTKRLLGLDMTHAIHRLGLRFLLTPVSSKSNDGMTKINAAFERILTGGTRFTD